MYPRNLIRTIVFILASVLVGSPLIASAQTSTDSTSHFTESMLARPRYQSRTIVLGDLDLDGDLDAVVGIAGGGDRIYLNQGRTFVEHKWQIPASHNGSLALGDMDGDGDLDLAVGVYQVNLTIGSGKEEKVPPTNLIYRNTAADENLGFDFVLHTELPDTGERTRAIAWVDFDGDTDLDLAVGNQNQQSYLYINNGQGEFVQSDAWQPGIAFTDAIAWGDVDNDRDPDLLIGNQNQPSELYLNRDGRLQLSDWQPAPAFTRSVAWADVDLDGDLDMTIGNDGTESQIYLNDKGTFSNQPDLTLPAIVLQFIF